MSLRLRITLFFTLFLAVVLTLAATTVYALTQRSLVESVAERTAQALHDLGEKGYRDGARTLPGDAYYLISLSLTPPTDWSELRRGSVFDGFRYAGVSRSNPMGVDPERLFDNLGDDTYRELFRTGSASAIVRFTDDLGNDRAAYVRAVSTSIKVTRIDTSGTAPTDSARTADFPVILLVGFPVATDTLTQLRTNLIRTVVVSFVVFALCVWLLSKRMIAPVKRLTQAAASVSGRELSRRVPVPKSHDEVRELAVTLNHMLDRLQESFETQRRFTADASHELRTPVTAIAGHASYLLRRTDPSDAQRDSLDVIKRETERMTRLVGDLLELARADAGFTVDLRPMDLVEVAEAVHMEIAPSAGNTRIDVVAARPKVMILGDASRLKQVLLNLVQNALNAGASTITIAIEEDPHTVRLRIRDNGPGIPPEALPHLFERFYRVDSARSTHGSGLGLAIVKWIVDQHQGRVEVASTPGAGTTFTVSLPALGTASPADPANETPSAAASAPRVVAESRA
ncbi:MAG: HAMP domain-containing sensor histidine kinase [Trueperaceae bacterium]|nr:HAMP domain-containing sensor histidine kinase [Trueperaceae bacterium]